MSCRTNPPKSCLEKWESPLLGVSCQWQDQDWRSFEKLTWKEIFWLRTDSILMLGDKILPLRNCLQLTYLILRSGDPIFSLQRCYYWAIQIRAAIGNINMRRKGSKAVRSQWGQGQRARQQATKFQVLALWCQFSLTHPRHPSVGTLLEIWGNQPNSLHHSLPVGPSMQMGHK